MRRLFMDQSTFDTVAVNTKRGHAILLAGALMLVLAASTFAIVVMGPRLVREGSLLFFGSQANGVLREINVSEVGKFKGGAPKYRLTLAYQFATADGKTYDGETTRQDVRTPPSLRSGDTIGVFYEVSDPVNSVAEHNLRIDVYALALFLPFLAVVGIGGPLWYLMRWRNWRRRRRSEPV